MQQFDNMTLRRLQRSGILTTYILLLIITVLGSYLILYSPPPRNSPQKLIEINYEELVREIDDTKDRIFEVTYSPVFYPKHYNRFYGNGTKTQINDEKRNGLATANRDDLSYHSLWLKSNEYITRDQLFPTDKRVDSVLHGLVSAKIVYVELMDTTDYESGTSEKWIVVLEGGQKAVIKIVWEEKGRMKRGGLCNYGFEMAWSEIAAFNLHRVLDFRNTPYVVGRKINLETEIMPVATPEVLKNIKKGLGNETCVVGKCYFCKRPHNLCSSDSVVEASIAYWVPRHLHLYTWWPKYMPFSTPRMDEWGQIGFNNKTFCKKVQQEIEPYGQEEYYLDLFDFAILDTLMYHFDSKHYIIEDKSEAHGATVRLDHGRAFCDHNKDDEQIFLAPITQCCTLRRSTYDKIKIFKKGLLLTRRLKALNDKDILAPLLEEQWYTALERRLRLIFNAIERCAKANNGLSNILV